jgi:GTP cyclohydrolase-4
MTIDHDSNLAPDINNNIPMFGIHLKRVGTLKVCEQVSMIVRECSINVPGEFKIFVDLPRDYRAIHMSRHIEAIQDVIREQSSLGAPSFINLLPVDICSRIATRLLQFHEYSNTSEVEFGFVYFVPKKSPIRKMEKLENYDVILSASAQRQGNEINVTRSLEVIVVGATTCPCAQNQISYSLLKNLTDKEKGILNSVLERISSPTHMQRAKISIKLIGSCEFDISIDKLILLAENSMSVSTHGLLKRDDEEAIIQKAFKQPRFVEDVVREAAKNLVLFNNLDGNIEVIIKAETQESIHKHDAYAEINSSINSLINDVSY